jgi:hypothetical protein
MDYKELQMKNKTLILFALLVLASPMVGQTQSHSNAATCKALLNKARLLEKEHGGTPRIDEALSTYNHAFGVCADADLEPELAAQAATRHGNVLFVYQNDPASALSVLGSGLDRVTAELGQDHPARIPLLDQMADIYAARSLRESTGSDLVRSLDLWEEALRVRRVAFGERSLEASHGLVMLAATYLPYLPELAEEYSREAVDSAREHQNGVNSQVYDALLMLEEALHKQGRLAAAAEAEEEAHNVYAQLEGAGRTPE